MKIDKKKQSYIKLAGVAVLLSALALLAFYVHIPFYWENFFDPKSKQPFGCYYFDRVMEHAFPEGYEYSTEITQSMIDSGLNVILYEGEYYDDDSLFYHSRKGKKKPKYDTKLEAIQAHGGNVVLIGENSWLNRFGGGFNGECEDGQLLESNDSNLNTFYVDLLKMKPIPRREATWVETGEKYQLQPFVFQSLLHEHLYSDRPWFCPLITSVDDDGEKRILAYCIYATKKTRTIYIDASLLMTNYTVLDGRNVELVMRLLAPLKGRKVVRIVKDPKYHPLRPEGDNKQVFRFILSQPPLRWALNLTMITLVIFCIFSSRRKMRAIPIAKEYANSTLNFALHMGSYFFTKGKNKEMVLLKYELFLNVLQATYHWDTENMKAAELARRIASVSDVEQPQLQEMLSSIMRAKHDLKYLSRNDVVDYMHLMDKIIKEIQI